MRIFENPYIYIDVEPSVIPWLKIFTQTPFKEFSQCDAQTKNAIFLALDVIEKAMLDYYAPEKINIASFGNYVPHVHFHIMARFKNDPFFPEPMWGTKQRDGSLSLPPIKPFIKTIQSQLI